MAARDKPVDYVMVITPESGPTIVPASEAPEKTEAPDAKAKHAGKAS